MLDFRSLHSVNCTTSPYLTTRNGHGHNKAFFCVERNNGFHATYITTSTRSFTRRTVQDITSIKAGLNLLQNHCRYLHFITRYNIEKIGY